MIKIIIMDSLICEHTSNWGSSNLLIRSDIPLVSDRKEYKFKDNVISDKGITLRDHEEGVHFYINESYFYLRGSKQWKGFKWYGNGQKRHEFDYLNNKKHGKEIWFYESGKMGRETIYSVGKRHGKDKVWYGNGQKSYETNYLDNKKNGKYTKWNKVGEIIEEKYYVEDIEQ